MSLDAVDTLCELIARPSVNPMGGEATVDCFEERVGQYLGEVFSKLDVPWQRQEVAPQRANIVARVDPPVIGPDTPLIVFEAHQDTVPVEGMTVPPFRGVLREGRLYGRGACDVKGGMAAMLRAFSRLAAERPEDAPIVVMACTVDEELGVTGAQALPKLWEADASEIFPRRPDAVIVAEPTELNVIVAHKGCVRWKCRVTGRAAHSSTPQEGENAIYHMARVIAALERYAADHVGRLHQHALLGTPTLSVGTVHGGISVNAVPDHCEIQIDRRVNPGEDPRAAYEHVGRFLEQELPASTPVIHDAPYSISPGLTDACNRPLAQRLVEVARDAGLCSEPQGARYGTDAWVFSNREIPTVVFGPGSVAQAHTIDEWIDVQQLRQAADVLFAFARSVGQRSLGA